MDSEDEIGDEDRGIYSNINRWNFILPKLVWIKYIIWLSCCKPIYFLESNIPNESSNIFMTRKKSRMNVRIYSRLKNPRIFKRLNIFVKKYSNIFKYPNICYTLSCVTFSKDFNNLPEIRPSQPSECAQQRTLNIVHAQTAAQQQSNGSYEARMSGKCGETSLPLLDPQSIGSQCKIKDQRYCVWSHSKWASPSGIPDDQPWEY